MALTTRPGFRLLLKYGTGGLPPAVVDRMYDDFDRGTQRAVLRLDCATGDLADSAQLLAHALLQHPGPTLVVWGQHDQYLPSVSPSDSARSFRKRRCTSSKRVATSPSQTIRREWRGLSSRFSAATLDSDAKTCSSRPASRLTALRGGPAHLYSHVALMVLRPVRRNTTSIAVERNAT